MKKSNIFKSIICVIVMLALSIYFVWSFHIAQEELFSSRYIHLSFDDAIILFEDLTNNDYNSIFEHPLLGYLKEQHENSDMTVSFYCFYEKKNFDLSMCTDRYAEEFSENASWLKFGFHDIDGVANLAEADFNKGQGDYRLVVDQLLRITGSEECIDTVPRLQNFAGSRDALTGLLWYNTNCGVRGLLSADDDRNSYYFDEQVSAEIRNADSWKDRSNGLMIVPTDLRLELTDTVYEDLSELAQNSERGQIIEVFTHEWAVDDTIYGKIDEVVKFASEGDYKWSFAQDVLF